jgi:MarR family transcriptional regulator, organic hydroperoxide resistance regulator
VPAPSDPPSSSETQPDLDAIIEVLAYLETESRRLTKGLAGQYGLTGPQLVVVKLLEPVGQLSLSELSWKIRARNSTVTGIIDRMERERLVVRRRSEDDRRVVHIELTAKGRRLASEIRVEPMEILRTVLSELSPRDAADLKRIVTKLARRVGELVNQPAETIAEALAPEMSSGAGASRRSK